MRLYRSNRDVLERVVLGLSLEIKSKDRRNIFEEFASSSFTGIKDLPTASL